MIPSRVLASGLNSLSSLNIGGDVDSGATATGTTSSDAYQIVSVYTQFTTVDASTGAILPTTETGMELMIANDGAHTLTVYPSSGTIDGASSVSIAAGKRRIFYGMTLTTLVSLLGA